MCLIWGFEGEKGGGKLSAGKGWAGGGGGLDR